MVLVAALLVTAVTAMPVAASPGGEAVRWNERGLTLTEESRHAEAVEAFRRALAAAPDDATIRRNLALARSNLAVKLLAEGDLEHASHNAEEALKLQPGDPIVVLNVAACEDEKGYPARAAALVRRARKVGEDVPQVR